MRSGRRRIAILSVLLLVASAALAWTQRTAMLDADDRADVAVGEAARERAVGEATSTAADAVRVRQEELAGASTRVDQRAIAAVSDRKALEVQLADLGVQVEQLQAELRQIGDIDSSQRISLAGLKLCLDGIRDASFRQLGGDGAAVVSELREVEDFCRATMAALGLDGGSGYAFDFADPFILPFEEHYYAYATNAGPGAVQLITSDDLADWTLEGEALASVPEWAESGNTWAPSVVPVDDGWVLYYTVRERASGVQCISSASADDPKGPFLDDSEEPLVCQRELGGSIDPSPFVDEHGVVNLLWKSDEIVENKPARLWVMPLDETGRKPGWFPIQLGKADQPWEGRVIEGPAMVEHGDEFYVLYSGNNYNTADYAVGYLRCESPLGPCTKPKENVVLRSHDSQNGPGGTELFTATDGTIQVVYHAWKGDDIGYPNKRQIHIAPLTFAPDGRPGIG